MTWSRAVWKEHKQEEEMTIPTVWIENNSVVRWPTGLSVLKACNQQWLPKDNWLSFPLIKVKLQSDDRNICDAFDFTTTDETDVTPDVVSGKKKKTITQRIKNTIPSVAYPSPPPLIQTTRKSRSPHEDHEDTSKIPQRSPTHRKPNHSKIPRYVNPASSPYLPLSSQYSSPTTPVTQSSVVAPSPRNPQSFRSKTTQLLPSKSSQSAHSKLTKEPPSQPTPVQSMKKSQFPLSDKKFQYKVMHRLAVIEEKLDRLGIVYEKEDSAFFIKQFDIVEEFMVFDEGLDEKVNRDNFKRQISNLGGHSCHTHVKAILTRIMTNKLMSSFNLDGNNNNHAFRKTRLHKGLTENTLSQYTASEIDKCVGNLLKRAPDRKHGGGRNKRLFEDVEQPPDEIAESDDDSN